MPYAKPLELAALPLEDKIEAAARALLHECGVLLHGGVDGRRARRCRALSDTMEQGTIAPLAQARGRQCRRGRRARRDRDRQGHDGVPGLRRRRAAARSWSATASRPSSARRSRSSARRARMCRRQGRRREAETGAKPSEKTDLEADRKAEPGGRPEAAADREAAAPDSRCAAADRQRRAGGAATLRASPIARRMAERGRDRPAPAGRQGQRPRGPHRQGRRRASDRRRRTRRETGRDA